MLCLFLGLSLSLFSRRKRSIAGCSVGASLLPSQNGWPSSPSWIITLSSSLGKWLPLPNHKICSITFGTPKQRGTKSEVKTSARGHHDAPRGP